MKKFLVDCATIISVITPSPNAWNAPRNYVTHDRELFISIVCIRSRFICVRCAFEVCKRFPWQVSSFTRYVNIGEHRTKRKLEKNYDESLCRNEIAKIFKFSYLEIKGKFNYGERVARTARVPISEVNPKVCPYRKVNCSAPRPVPRPSTSTHDGRVNLRCSFVRVQYTTLARFAIRTTCKKARWKQRKCLSFEP